ncbi:MAG: hypothetical protein GWN01_16210 [Nitrosopumilaceae archaeon]|nr:hypothetical protein [Nitrosopumilaceae archaeon]NIU02381.1 hypothetical protein [Nitrosopumilaceae archaeon]NIU88838.1 hypothetical protein [Nitrosopumilaceae archaeon]NIV66962.1 hypothetical protein [Nitrosopumilaceae archaeon]NIX62982.1 hypothetical protein [Nitrosopumilaceae archaeon]
MGSWVLSVIGALLFVASIPLFFISWLWGVAAFVIAIVIGLLLWTVDIASVGSKAIDKLDDQ